jgi:hypothetical protein
MALTQTFQIAESSPTGSGTTVGSKLHGLTKFDYFMIDADLTNTGSGTLNVYLQRKIDIHNGASTETIWRDWVAFPQLTAATATTYYTITPQPNNGIVAVGTGSDTAATPALAANSMVGGHPGDVLRAVYVAAGISALVASAQKIRITGRKDPRG